MLDMFAELSPLLQAFVAGSFTWLVTALGAASVLFWRNPSTRLLDAMLGFAAGVMLAAAFWSLLAPAIELAETSGTPGWLPAAAGVLAGAAFLRVADQLLPHLHPFAPPTAAEGIATHWRRTTLLVLAITLHNIPEGLALGVAFGAAAQLGDAGLAAAMALALGIALQNFPEGVAVALPLRRSGVSAGRSLWYGQLSAVVEPLAAVLGAAAVLTLTPLLPYALAFAAGAMIYVVIEELIPEAQQSGSNDLATTSALLGFTLMMVLDVALG